MVKEGENRLSDRILQGSIGQQRGYDSVVQEGLGGLHLLCYVVFPCGMLSLEGTVGKSVALGKYKLPVLKYCQALLSSSGADSTTLSFQKT